MFFLGFFSSLLLENKKSPAVPAFFPALGDFLIYPSMSAPSSVLRLLLNAISPFTTPEEPITTLSAETFPSSLYLLSIRALLTALATMSGA